VSTADSILFFALMSAFEFLSFQDLPLFIVNPFAGLSLHGNLCNDRAKEIANRGRMM
jgi:hypothetical protein